MKLLERSTNECFRDGRVPLELKLALTGNGNDVIQAVLSASDAERQRITNPKNDQEQTFRKSVYDKLSEEERSVLGTALKQKKMGLI